MKRKVWRRIVNLNEYDFEGSIEGVIAMLQKYKETNKDKALRLEVESNKWEEGDHLELQYEDLETDEEEQLRERKGLVEKKKQEDYERAQLAKLKAKYES